MGTVNGPKIIDLSIGDPALTCSFLGGETLLIILTRPRFTGTENGPNILDFSKDVQCSTCSVLEWGGVALRSKISA